MVRLYLLLLALVAVRAAPLPAVSLGPIESVLDWPTQANCSCAESPGCTDPNDPDSPDTPPRAFVDKAGIAHLWASDAESRQSTRNASEPSARWAHNCSVSAPSPFDCRTDRYSFQTWLHSPYMMDDGVTAFALTHMEYHGWSCVSNSSCPSSNGGDCAMEAIQLWVSRDGGWTWSPQPAAAPANLIAVSPYTYEYSRDNFNRSELGFGDPSSIVFDPSSGTYNVFIAAANPDIGDNGWTGVQQRGQCLLRSPTPLDAASWRAWDGADFTVQFVNPYAAPIANLSAHACEPVSAPDFIIVNVGWSTKFSSWIASGFGDYTYPNGTRIPCCGAWLYSTSDDLTSWAQPQLVRPCKQEGLHRDWEYDPAFLSEDAWTLRGKRNWHESIGDTTYMYFWQQDLSDRGRSIFKQSVTFL